MKFWTRLLIAVDDVFGTEFAADAREREEYKEISINILAQLIEETGPALIDWMTDYLIFDENRYVAVSQDSDEWGDFLYASVMKGNGQKVDEEGACFTLGYCENADGIDIECLSRVFADTLNQIVWAMRTEEIEF